MSSRRSFVHTAHALPHVLSLQSCQWCTHRVAQKSQNNEDISSNTFFVAGFSSCGKKDTIPAFREFSLSHPPCFSVAGSPLVPVCVVLCDLSACRVVPLFFAPSISVPPHISCFLKKQGRILKCVGGPY